MVIDLAMIGIDVARLEWLRQRKRLARRSAPQDWLCTVMGDLVAISIRKSCRGRLLCRCQRAWWGGQGVTRQRRIVFDDERKR